MNLLWRMWSVWEVAKYNVNKYTYDYHKHTILNEINIILIGCKNNSINVIYYTLRVSEVGQTIVDTIGVIQ